MYLLNLMLIYNWLLYLFIGNDYFKGGKHIKDRKIDSCWELLLEAARGGHHNPDARIGECGGDPRALVLAEIHLLWHRLVSVASITSLQLSSPCVRFWEHPSLAHHIPHSSFLPAASSGAFRGFYPSPLVVQKISTCSSLFRADSMPQLCLTQLRLPLESSSTVVMAGRVCPAQEFGQEPPPA